MATTSKVTSEEIASLRSHTTMPVKKLTDQNIFANVQETIRIDPIDPARISKESANRLTMSSVVKAGVVFLGTIGLYYLTKTGILSYFGRGTKNPNSKDVDNEITNVKNKENALSLKVNLNTEKQANNPLVDQIKQTNKGEDRTVKFEEIKVKNLQKVKEKNVLERSSYSRRSISVQNPIPDQHVIVGRPFNLEIDGNYVFSSSDTVSLDVTNIPTWLNFLLLNPNPTFKSAYNTPGQAYGVTLFGDYAYMADGGSGLQIINITDPSNPTFKGSYDTPDFAYAVAVSGNYAYVTDYTDDLLIIDISDPSSPIFKSSYNTPGAALGVALSGNYAYIADGTSLQIIDITDPSNPMFKGSYDTPDTALGVALSGNYAYVADVSSLQIINITDPSNPMFKGSYDTPDVAFGIALLRNYAYVADWASGLQIIDISNSTNPTFKGSYNTPGVAYGVAVSGNYAYVADWNSGLQIIDISNPANSIFRNSCNTPGAARGVALSGNYAYVADVGLQIIALNPNKLILSGTPSSVGIYSVDIGACNEAEECVTDNFDIIVTDPSDTETDTDTETEMDLTTTLIIVGSITGAVCIASLSCVLIGSGIVAIGLYRNKISKNKSNASNKEEEQKSESSISGNDVKVVVNDELIVQQEKSKILENRSISKEEKETILPEDEKDVELDEMPNSTEEEISKVANVSDSKKLSDNLYCPISSKLIENPVILVESGQTYDRKSIETWFKDHDTDPLSGEKLTNKQLITNFAVKKLIEECQEKENKKIKE